VALEGVQVGRPKPTVRGQPAVDLGQRFGAELVPAALGVLTNPDETSVAKDLQMLGGARLAEAKLLDQFADRARSFEQQIEDAASGGFGEHRERRGHLPNITR
jgi:hypothetical protein